MVTVLKFIGPPGSESFLALCCVIGLGLRRAGWTRAGQRWLLIVYLAYVIAGVPLIANAIGSRLSTYAPIEDLNAIRDADSIIVLHGDNVLGRAREAARLLAATRANVVVVLGDDVFAGFLMDQGIPEDKLVIDSFGFTTAEQIRIAKRIIREHDLKMPVLVASRLQMPRIAELLHTENVEARLGPAPLDDEPPTRGAWQLVPTYKALRLTRDAIYEHLAVRYYRRQGLTAVR